jgi:hypothetical protein
MHNASSISLLLHHQGVSDPIETFLDVGRKARCRSRQWIPVAGITEAKHKFCKPNPIELSLGFSGRE